MPRTETKIIRHTRKKPNTFVIVVVLVFRTSEVRVRFPNDPREWKNYETFYQDMK